MHSRPPGPPLGAPFCHAGTHPNGRELCTVPVILADGQSDLIAALITMGVAVIIAVILLAIMVAITSAAFAKPR